MKYYVYVSLAKLQMLYEQIPTRFRDRLATELKVDFKLLSATFSEDPSPKTRHAKLEILIGYLRSEGLLGTIEHPEKYFAGAIDMKWGPLGDPSETDTVFFAGQADSTLVGLGGSIKHVLGHEGMSKYQPLPPSHLRSMAVKLTYSVRLAGLAKEGVALHEEELPMDELVKFARDGLLDGPYQRLEFVAKRLFSNSRVLVGSPLYVSLVD